MAGTIPLSMTQQFDEFGEPLAGGQLFIYQAGTVATPQNPYQDTGLTIALPNPITLDAAGRIPQFFLADGSIKIRLTDVNGVVQLAADNILVIGPSAGGGGGGSIDPTTIMQTGDIKPRYGTGVLTGFVRGNGRTIGSASSGANEFADPTAQALFNYLWNADASLAVTPSRGASSAADWAANKQIATPDFRGCAIAGLDDMGNVAANRLTATYLGTAATVLGAFGGGQSVTLALANLPAFTPAGTITAFTVNVSGSIKMSNYQIAGGGTAPVCDNVGLNGFVSGPLSLSGSGSANFTGTNTSATMLSTPFSRLPPMKLITVYIKL